jgi:hypothetical protein
MSKESKIEAIDNIDTQISFICKIKGFEFIKAKDGLRVLRWEDYREVMRIIGFERKPLKGVLMDER